MQKKIINNHNNLKINHHQQKGLFNIVNLKKHQLLQQLKTGTLFHIKTNKHPTICQNIQPQLATGWLDQITLGIQEESILTFDLHNENEKIKQMKHLPLLSGKVQQARFPHLIKKQQKSFTLSNRCNKMVCLSKKLLTTGAWNTKNPNNILKNIQKLQASLQLSPSSLTQNDFRRVNGLRNETSSFDNSILTIDNTSLLHNKKGFNPFKNFSNFTQTLSSMFPQERIINKRIKKIKKRQKLIQKQNEPKRNNNNEIIDQKNLLNNNNQEKKDYFLPNFLMRTLYIK